MTNEWKKGVLAYIIANNIQHKQEMDINQILKVIAPGQTSKSVLSFLDELKREKLRVLVNKISYHYVTSHQKC